MDFIEKKEKIEKTNKIKIFYKKEDGLFCGAGFMDYMRVAECLSEPLEKKNSVECEYHILGSLINYQKQFKGKVDKHIKKSKQDKIKKEIEEKISSIVVDFDVWCEFIKNNYDVIKIVDGNLLGEVREPTIEEARVRLICIRKDYLRKTSINWGHDWDSCPQEIKDKRTSANIQINEIEAITNKEDLITYKDF